MIDTNSPTITLTEPAQAYIRKLGALKGLTHFYLRFGLKKSGCSGFAYVFDFTTAPTADDYCLNIAPDITVLLAKENAAFLNGTELDYAIQAMGGVMHFHNPNEVASCGCGESVAFNEKAEN
jgi:iron-sulfur cluster assembly protein